MPALKNPKYEAVAQSFIADKGRIGWRAYRAHYPKSTQHAAETGWSRLWKNVEFRARIRELDEASAEVAVKAGVMSAHEVLLELSHLARSNMQQVVQICVARDVVDAVKQLTPEQAAAIAEITVESYEEHDPEGAEPGDKRTVKRVKFKLHDKHASLVSLGRHWKLFTEKIELDDKRELAKKLDAAIARRLKAAGGRAGAGKKA